MGLLDSVFTKIRRTNVLDTVTSQSLSSADTLKSLASNYQHNCLAIHIQITDTSLVSDIGVIARNSSSLSASALPIFKSSGEVINRIKKSGIYYVDITGFSDISVYNYTGIATTAKISYNLVGEMPQFPQTIRPIECIASSDITLTSDTEYTVLSRLPVTAYKFLFVTIYSTGSGGNAKNHTFRVSMQPYSIYAYLPGTNNAKAGEEKIVLEVDSKYSSQTEWQQVLGDLVSVFLNVTSPTAGDIFHVNLYGVR